MKQICNEVCALIKAFGFEPSVERYVNDYGANMFDISFQINGFESFPQRYKDAIIMLVKNHFREFDYAPGGTQHIYLMETPYDGIEPDDDRYSELVYDMIHSDFDKHEINGYLLTGYRMHDNYEITISQSPV